jgi:hypothetical protein
MRAAVWEFDVFIGRRYREGKEKGRIRGRGEGEVRRFGSGFG